MLAFVAYQLHLEVWLLIAFLVGAYTYMVKVVGPRAVPEGQPVVRRRQVVAFAAAMVLLWFASDWPVHDVAEEHLYWMHMLQHMTLQYFVPPLALIATPEWLLRLLIGDGRLYRAVVWLTKPVVAGFFFTVVVIVTHIPGVVNASVENGALHYALHVLVVTSALLMWMPICGPLPERRIGPGAQMIYLFMMSIVPTVPAGWLTFAEGSVYDAYDSVQIWGFDTESDQQLAGAVMKVGGSIFLWGIVVYLFFGRFMKNWEEQNTFKRTRRVPDQEIVGHSDAPPLTYEQVTTAFASVPAPDEPSRPSAGE